MPIPIKHCFLLYKKKHIVRGNRAVFSIFEYLIFCKLLVYQVHQFVHKDIEIAKRTLLTLAVYEILILLD